MSLSSSFLMLARMCLDVDLFLFFSLGIQSVVSISRFMSFFNTGTSNIAFYPFLSFFFFFPGTSFIHMLGIFQSMFYMFCYFIFLFIFLFVIFWELPKYYLLSHWFPYTVSSLDFILYADLIKFFQRIYFIPRDLIFCLYFWQLCFIFSYIF